MISLSNITTLSLRVLSSLNNNLSLLGQDYVDAFGMVVVILNLIFVGHVTLEKDELLGNYCSRTKARSM